MFHLSPKTDLSSLSIERLPVFCLFDQASKYSWHYIPISLVIILNIILIDNHLTENARKPFKLDSLPLSLFVSSVVQNFSTFYPVLVAIRLV